MTTSTTPSNVSDADLLGSIMAGDREACRCLIERYQGLVCAITYAGCGDVHQSEDLAQETFLEAWKHLRDVEQPDRLKSWLCGIARNLTNSARRKQGRMPVIQSQPDEETLDGSTPTPPEELIGQEEISLLWKNLERLPEEYREPLVLYYRQEESIAAVAEAMEISEESVRQRLCRGRAMLAQRLEGAIYQGLRNSGPSKAFALAVVAAIPGLASSANAAALSAAAVKGTASAKAAVSAGALVSALAGPLIGLVSGYAGYRFGLAQTIAPEERRFMRRYFLGVLLGAAVFTALFAFSLHWTHWLGMGPVGIAIVIPFLALGYALALFISCIWYQRRIREIRDQVTAQNPDMQAKARAASRRWNVEYRSRWTLLGLPLVHINMGLTPEGRMPIARGWIAIGAKAYAGLFACGAIAIAPITFGGMAIGLLCWGGFAAGAAVFAGFGIGIWAVGASVVGWMAVGAYAVGWLSATGVVAVAHDFALGVVAVARHANDQAAESFFAANRFSRLVRVLLTDAHWPWLVLAAPIAAMVLQAIHNKLARDGKKSSQSGK